MKKTRGVALIILVTILMLCSCGEKTNTEFYNYASATDIIETGDTLTIELLKTEEDLQYYAYLDMNDADDELKPVIQAARNIIIHRHDWVADGEASIVNKDGELVEEIPHFYELFPEDWEVPIVN